MLVNIAIPAFLPHSFITLVGIFVIALIEGWFLKRHLELSYWQSYKHSLIANWRSTIVGIPVAWIAWLAGLIPITMALSSFGFEPHPIVEAISLHSATIGGMMPNEWTSIGISSAWVILLVPFWIGSVWIERKAIRKRLPDCDYKQLSKAVIRGNLVSYSIFLVFGIAQVVDATVKLPETMQRYEEFRQKRQQEQLQHQEELKQLDHNSRKIDNKLKS